MLKEWQWNILFFVGVGGAVFLLIGPEFGIKLSHNPTALTGVGAILTYILTQRNYITKDNEDKKSFRRRIRRNEEAQDREVSDEERGDET